MKINKAICSILKKKEITKSELGVQVGVKNIRDLLSTDNLTINSVLNCIKQLEYNLVLQPSKTEIKPYQILIDNSDEVSSFTVYGNEVKTMIRKAKLDNIEFFSLDDLCERIGINLQSVWSRLSSTKRLIIARYDNKLHSIHFIDKNDFDFVLENYQLNKISIEFIDISVEKNDSTIQQEQIKVFIDELCEIDISSTTDCSILYSDYLDWCNSNKIKYVDRKIFDEVISRRFTKIKGKFFGIRRIL